MLRESSGAGAGAAAAAPPDAIDRERDKLLASDPDCFVHPVTGKPYFLPRGFLFEYVSGANYLGELITWVGFALMTFSLEGLAFALLTFANLCPRARRTHAWYKEHFPHYPPRRTALIPFLL